MARKALLVSYGGGHVTMVAPVVRQLEGRGVECTVLALTTGYRKARQLGLQPLGYRDFAHLVPDAPRVLAWGRELAGENTHPDVEAEESHWYLGVNFAQWVSELGEGGARARYRELGRRAFHPIGFMTALLRDVRPDVVVATNTPRSEGAAVEAAVKLGIPSLAMTDLFVDATDPFTHRTVRADRITVLSAAVRDAVVAAGIEPWRIAVTGNPAFDALRSAEMQEQGALLRQQLGWRDKRVILFAGHTEELPGTPPAWRHQGFGTEVQGWLQRWVAEHPGDALIVRYHPSESHLYPPLGEGARLRRSEPSREPLHPVLLASDIVIVQTSTVGLEAALCGRRVLCLQFAPSVAGASYDYARLGLAEGIASFDDLARALSIPGAASSANPDDYSVGDAARKVADEALALLARGA